MNELLKSGQVVETEISRQSCQVEAFLGGGGQGEVYRARWAGGPFALKWYFAHTATEDQRCALQSLVKEPAPSEAFLWPLDMAFCPRRAWLWIHHAAAGTTIQESFGPDDQSHRP